MKTDREFLELAAKAAGIEGFRYSDGFGCMAHWNESDGGWFDACGLWDPLTDDGDALRLAVVLGLDVTIDNGRSHTWADTHSMPCEALVKELHGNDALAATRRAIVRAAAALGEAMQ